MGKAFGHRSAKVKGDLFETPYNLTRDLLKVEEFDPSKSFLEPCAGKKAIVSVVEKELNIKMDYFDKHYGDRIQDFLDYPSSNRVDYIITNPPYGRITDKIVLKAKEIYKEKIAMLLRINYLSGETRFLENVHKELSKVYIYTRMPNLGEALRTDGSYSTAMIVYGWFIWEKGYTGNPSINWISNQYSVASKRK